MSAVRISAADIRAGMLKRWAPPEYAVMWEVANGTGATSRRWADALIMSLWPSRGLELHGVEIKISRADWRREAADPRKAEEVGQFCDRWWVHTAPGVVSDLSEVPPAWGLREFDGKVWRTLKEAEKTDAVPITRSFLAAMLRRADGTMRSLVDEARREGRAAVAEEMKEARARFRDDVDRAVQRRVEELERSAANVALFEQAFGEGSALNWSIDHVRLGRAARALHVCVSDGYFVSGIAKRLRAAADEIEALDALLNGSASRDEGSEVGQ